MQVLNLLNLQLNLYCFIKILEYWLCWNLLFWFKVIKNNKITLIRTCNYLLIFYWLLMDYKMRLKMKYWNSKNLLYLFRQENKYNLLFFKLLWKVNSFLIHFLKMLFLIKQLIQIFCTKKLLSYFVKFLFFKIV